MAVFNNMAINCGFSQITVSERELNSFANPQDLVKEAIKYIITYEHYDNASIEKLVNEILGKVPSHCRVLNLLNKKYHDGYSDLNNRLAIVTKLLALVYIKVCVCDNLLKIPKTLAADVLIKWLAKCSPEINLDLDDFILQKLLIQDEIIYFNHEDPREITIKLTSLKRYLPDQVYFTNLPQKQNLEFLLSFNSDNRCEGYCNHYAIEWLKAYSPANSVHERQQIKRNWVNSLKIVQYTKVKNVVNECQLLQDIPALGVVILLEDSETDKLIDEYNNYNLWCNKDLQLRRSFYFIHTDFQLAVKDMVKFFKDNNCNFLLVPVSCCDHVVMVTITHSQYGLIKISYYNPNSKKLYCSQYTTHNFQNINQFSSLGKQFQQDFEALGVNKTDSNILLVAHYYEYKTAGKSKAVTSNKIPDPNFLHNQSQYAINTFKLGICTNDQKLVEQGLKLGFDPKHDYDGYSAIHMAVLYQVDNQIFKLLKKFGADFNKCSDFVYSDPHKLPVTPLRLAADLANSNIIKILLELGANACGCGHSNHAEMRPDALTEVKNMLQQRYKNNKYFNYFFNRWI